MINETEEAVSDLFLDYLDTYDKFVTALNKQDYGAAQFYFSQYSKKYSKLKNRQRQIHTLTRKDNNNVKTQG